MKKKGIIYAVSLGHFPDHITPEAQRVLSSIDVVAGHPGFIEMAKKYLNENIEVIDNTVTRKYAQDFEMAQQNRVAACVCQALKGKKVAILSGGDTGIWGEAGFFVEAHKKHDGLFELRIIPGVSGMVASAARVGAPLMNGFALISLGDEDTPFSVVEQRLKGAALGGFVIVLYKVIVESYDSPEFYPAEKYPELSPPDKCTKERLNKSYKILSEHISPDTPMAIIINTYDQTSYHHVGDNMLGSDDRKEKVILTEFRNFVKYSGEYRYLTTIIIGDNTTVVFDKYMYTPQWNYHWTYCPIMLEKVSNLPYLTSLKDFRKNEQT